METMRWILLTALLLSLAWNGEKITRSESEWKKLLGSEKYRTLREKKRERGFLGKYLYHTEEGIYSCAACLLPLFDSKSKYDAGSGWPCFKEPVFPKNVYYLEDPSMRFQRYEILCSRCDSHLGHLFRDGPPPKNFRYTVNSISLLFSQKEGKRVN